jgi:NADH dehydrogenase/NADH:ubiquinone oxidoreductase subunit G
VLKLPEGWGLHTSFCDHPDLAPIGSCKLCIVEIEGESLRPTSCTTLAEEGMVILTRRRSSRRCADPPWR